MHPEKILVVVPHEDDEINLAGATIYQAKKEGKQVICVFVTNGDWLYPVEIRMKEALQSLSILGVPEEDVVFLGYPDGGTHAERSLFMHGKDHILNANGRTHTYGSSFKKDFATLEYGEPQPYTWDNLLTDLKQVILKYKPDTIVGTDFDNHPDHRMCSIALDMAMGQILNRERNDYFPIYLKGFAYSTAFEGKDDLFSSINVLSTKINDKALTYPEFGTDNPAFEWNKRIRFPVPEECRTIDLDKNVIYKALCSYISQRIFVRAGRIINGDQVFWSRRTDNLAHQGKFTASSGNTKYLHDFQTMCTNDISIEKPVFEDYCWAPDANDQEKWCRCTFDTPQHIEEISFWGNIEKENQIIEGKLIFSNGYIYSVSALRALGRETKIHVLPQDDIRWIEFHMLKTHGSKPGIAEWGIYKNQEKELHEIQICCNGEFVYQWSLRSGEEISIYPEAVKENVQWLLNGQEIALVNIQKKVRKNRGPITIGAKLRNKPSIHTEIKLIFNSRFSYIRYVCKKIVERWKIHWMRLKMEPEHHKLKKLSTRK